MMAGLEQLHSFVGKFVSLWQSGLDASLHLNTKAGEAHINLRVGLGQAPLPPHQVPHLPRSSRPSRLRRREKRAATRNAAAEEAAEEAVNRELSEQEGADQPAVVDSDSAAEEATPSTTEEDAAEEATPTKTDNTEQAAAEKATEDPAAAEKVGEDFSCDSCDKKFKNLKGLRTHVAKKHKASPSPIPQLDGTCEVVNEAATYDFVSEYHKEDILYTLEEIFPGSKVEMVSRVKVGGTLSADHLCSVQIEQDTGNFCWPQMNSDQAVVFKDIKKH